MSITLILRRPHTLTLMAIGSVFLVVYLISTTISKPREISRLMWVYISRYDSMEIESQFDFMDTKEWGRVGVYYNYLIWHKGNKIEKYFISVDQNGPITNLQLRSALPGNRNLWLVSDGKVIATLNPESGQFINSYGAVMNAPLSDKDQEHMLRPTEDGTSSMKPVPYARWATPRGGVVLGCFHQRTGVPLSDILR